MANNEEKNTKTRKKRQTETVPAQNEAISALDAAIAAAISAPKPPKKAAQYQRPKQASNKSRKSTQAQRKPRKPKLNDAEIFEEILEMEDLKGKNGIVIENIASENPPAAAPKRQNRKMTSAAAKKPARTPRASKQTADKATANQPVKQRSRQTDAKETVPVKDFSPAEVSFPKKGGEVRIISLGGLNEIGKNMYLVEYGQDIVIIDCGMTFPDAEMPGVDIVIPDFTYVERNIERVRGVLLTHGHEDHIGGIPYLLKKADIPIYGTKLTLGLIENKLKEHNLGKVKLNIISAGDTVRLGGLTAEFIKVNHSIPGAVAVALKTPVGNIIHMGDFKVDYTPIEGGIIDLPRFAELGNEGVLALLSDSTNSERAGFTPSERIVGASFDGLFAKADGRRIIIATFSSNVHRVQQVINCSEKYNRKVAVFGRSMINVIKLSVELGYLKVPEGILIDIDQMKNYSDGEIVLITTGSQGEPMSALTRMALNDHRQVSITENDYIIISARPIPGNEKFVGRVVNELLKLGAEVVYEEMYEVHVSGHACQEEQKLILSLTRPKYFIPVHGEFKHLARHAATAKSLGVPAENIMIADIGNVIEIGKNGIRLNGSVPSGKVMVDGSGVGDVGAVVLKDRKHLAEDGVIIVCLTVDKQDRRLLSGPEIVTRGFVYEKESEELIIKARGLAAEVINSELATRHDYTAIRNKLKDELGDYFFAKTRRRPMIIPTIMDI